MAELLGMIRHLRVDAPGASPAKRQPAAAPAAPHDAPAAPGGPPAIEGDDGYDLDGEGDEEESPSSDPVRPIRIGDHMLRVARANGGSFVQRSKFKSFRSSSTREQMRTLTRALDMMVVAFGDRAPMYDFFEILARRIAALEMVDNGHTWAVASELELEDDMSSMAPDSAIQAVLKRAALKKKVNPRSAPATSRSTRGSARGGTRGARSRRGRGGGGAGGARGGSAAGTRRQ